MTEQEKINKAVELVKKFCPKYRVIRKKDSRVHRVIGWVLSKVGNKSYMTDCVTTLGQTSAFPGDNFDKAGLWQAVLHEGQHTQDSQKVGNIAFTAAYLFPQLIGALGIFYMLAIALALALGAPLYLLWGLLSLLFLAPLPAFGRAYAELRGYTVSFAIIFWSGNLVDVPACIESLVGVFSGPTYYYMWPFKSFIRWYFNSKLIELQTNLFVLTPYLAACKALAKELKA